MDAAHFTAKHDTENAKLYVVPELGRREDGVALYPLTARFEKAEEAPYVEYSFVTQQDGDYEVRFQMLSTNSYRHRVPVKLCYAMDGAAADTLTSIPVSHVPGILGLGNGRAESYEYRERQMHVESRTAYPATVRYRSGECGGEDPSCPGRNEMGCILSRTGREYER
jgi:hypothetical protein